MSNIDIKPTSYKIDFSNIPVADVIKGTSTEPKAKLLILFAHLIGVTINNRSVSTPVEHTDIDLISNQIWNSPTFQQSKNTSTFEIGDVAEQALGYSVRYVISANNKASALSAFEAKDILTRILELAKEVVSTRDTEASGNLLLQALTEEAQSLAK